MANYQITCVSKKLHLTGHEHIEWVGVKGESYALSVGEVYGRMDAGHRFYTSTDTEVIVHAYEEFGTGCVERLWGMFALALWDSRRKLLLLARDRLGKKPLVYFEDPSNGGLAFASELQSLLTHPSVPREVDPRAIDDYLTYLYVPSPTTAFRNVKKLKPGHRLVWHDGRVTVQPEPGGGTRFVVSLPMIADSSA